MTAELIAGVDGQRRPGILMHPRTAPLITQGNIYSGFIEIIVISRRWQRPSDATRNMSTVIDN